MKKTTGQRAQTATTPLTLGRLMACYDMCTESYLGRTVGHESEGASSGGGGDSRYGYLQQYRTTFEDTTVQRLFLFSEGRFRIGDGDALGYLEKERMAFLPVLEPETGKRHLVPAGVANRLPVTIYSHLLYHLWQHLRNFKGSRELQGAAVISFQNVDELEEMRETFARSCAELVDADGKPLFVPVKQKLLHRLAKYSVRN